MDGKTVFVWFYFYGFVCEVFVLRFIAVLLIWFRLEFAADVNKKQAFYHYNKKNGHIWAF